MMVVLCICLIALLFLTAASALRWRLDFYALFSSLVIKELPTPSESEMMELRQFVIRNTVKDFRERN